MLFRMLAGMVGAGIIGCVVHSSVMASGGYATDRAPLLIGLAAGLVVGSAVVGACWHARRVLLALLIGSAIIAGEGYALIQTAERTVTVREAQQAPIAAAEVARIRAQTRIDKAIAAKDAADKAVLADASKKSCSTHCRALLEQQVSDARAELDAARRAAAALPTAAAVSPLAERLGIEPWQLDLAAAALISVSANGLGAFLIAFAAHGGRREQKAPIPAMEIIQPMPSSTRAENRRDALKEATEFAKQQFRPSRDGRVALSDIRSAYHNWCAENGQDPLPDREMGTSLSQLFGRVGLVREGSSIVGIEWAKAIAQSDEAGG